MARWGLVLLVLFGSVATTQPAALQVSTAPDGSAQITLPGGQKITIPKEPSQAGVNEMKIAPDGETAGWLVEYDNDGLTSYPTAGMLIVWRAGKIIRRFPTGQVFWSWTFYAQGRQVAYHTGPLHGEEKSHCELHDVATGRRIAAWDGDLDSDHPRPAWSKGLDH